MTKKLLLIFFFTSFYLFSLISLYNYLNAKITTLVEEKTACEKTAAKNQIPTVSLNDIFLYGQKSKTVAASSPGRMYFSFQKTPISENFWQVEIKLEGNTESLADAADLEINFNNDLEVIDITTGDAFPLYPRKIITDGSMVLTGVSSIVKNNVTFGRAGRVFAIVKIKTHPDSVTRHFLTFNLLGTKIYFSAQNILDEEKNLTQIEI